MGEDNVIAFLFKHKKFSIKLVFKIKNILKYNRLSSCIWFSTEFI